MIQVETNDPKSLLSKINKAVEDKIIVTWFIDSDGDFSPIHEQWIGKAWITPIIKADNPNYLYFGIIGSKQHRITKTIYGVFFGRFAEMLLTHFDTDMRSLSISQLLDEDIDIFAN